LPDFQFVQSPVFTPTSCATCMTHRCEKGFIDLLVDDPVRGRMYGCVDCIEQAGRKAGMLPKDQVERLLKRVAQLETDLDAAYKSLEKEKSNKTISLADAKKLLKAGS